MIHGLSVAFSNGATHALEEGAIIKGTTALHVRINSVGENRPSVSTQIGLLRQILLSNDSSRYTGWFRRVTQVKEQKNVWHIVYWLSLTNPCVTPRETFR